MDNEESRKIVDEWKASNGYDDLLGAYSDAMSRALVGGTT